MIDWLRRAAVTPDADPVIEIDGRAVPVAIRRHPRARQMTLRIKPDGSAIAITIPRWGRQEEALAFARSRCDWLARQLASATVPQDLHDGDSVLFRGELLRIEWSSRSPRTPRLAGDRLQCGGPADHLTTRVQRWLEREALALLADDLAHYCALAGLAPPELRLARAQRRWGSCSSKGTVRINWRLVQAPDHVRRSVVAHEVAHLVHFDHSPQFHRCLSELFGEGLDDAELWLKQHGRTLYARFG